MLGSLDSERGQIPTTRATGRRRMSDPNSRNLRAQVAYNLQELRKIRQVLETQRVKTTQLKEETRQLSEKTLVLEQGVQQLHQQIGKFNALA
ncbi:hypothetical protein H4R33_000829 [Dimargaris cristalligena]|uniref:Uncharacterized protein n=1 Tax=Dimargaris cristalligena TaxID=215637 RepID=A0A4Q0A0A4_9FUNG|nr:hypothetical protein H4R33_000829 [Dimargaris cristalligena]RKP39417.1 hypothetical protein BJ085DRAFT_34359 [Dimargaris cristalligena]|eukprot:RKP39417.1 hypothetical protein BJ085DRAFT_34359 [Dimargaris cristalligena]